jgi:cathepsin L
MASFSVFKTRVNAAQGGRSPLLKHSRHNGRFATLSWMQLVNCDSSSYGCDGGWVTAAYDWVIANQKGRFAIEGYDSCVYDDSKMATTIVSYKAATPAGDEDSLMDAVYNDGVVIAGMDASHTPFQMYKTGIYNVPDCYQTHLDHMMLVVGYGAEGTSLYWILQNTWGTSWGIEGYMLVRRKPGELCTISRDTIVPIDQT